MKTTGLEYHPILKQISPSPEQILPILSRGRDVAVTAGAGTGKTRTLVARYLSLLAEGIPLNSLVAITFTKKAAREMRNRVREEIRTYLARIGENSPDYTFWREIYTGLDAARISTIHSLAADILRQHPAELGIDPHFELIEEGQMALLKAGAVEAALEWASQDAGAPALFVSFGDWALRRVVRRMLSSRLDVEDAFRAIPGDLWELWRPVLLDPIQTFIGHPEVAAGMERLASLEGEGIFERAADAGDQLVEHLRIVINNWKIITRAVKRQDWITVSRCLGPLRGNLLQKGRQENWSPANPREDIRAIQAVYDQLLLKKNLDLGLDQKLAQEIIPALESIFNFAISWYDTAKAQLQGMDFDDLESKSLELLKNHADIAVYWQEQIQALLVDEYQDTNRRQRELVNLLNGGRNKLFIVGDGKQSIYRFRGADVEVFRLEQEQISRRGENYQLATSYRAHPALLENLNRMLEPVLGCAGEAPYIEPFAGLVAGREESSKRLPGPFVELHLAAGTKSEGGLEKAAEALSARIIDLILQSEKEARAAAGNSFPPLTFADVAVLCRASGSFGAYENAFEKAGIPYLTVAGQGFFNRPEIRDLLNILRSVADPLDDLALAGLLRSPGIGLSDADLLHLRDYQQKQNLPSLLGTLGKVAGSNLPVDAGLTHRALELIEYLRGLVGRTPVAGIVDAYLQRTGYLAALGKIGQQRSVQNIKKFLGDAKLGGMVSVADFLDAISEQRDVAVRESEAITIAEGAVQIMTVHQAKGLEFPIVVLGDASRKERSYQDLILDQQLGLVLPYGEDQIRESDQGDFYLERVSSAAYAIASEGEKSREDAEADRLLYVAATRAQEMLIISGVVGAPSRDQGFRNLPGWLGKFAGGIGLYQRGLDFLAEGEDIHHFTLSSPGLEAAVYLYELNAGIEPREYKLHDDKKEPYSPYQELPSLDEKMPREVDRSQMRRVATASQDAYAPAWLVGEVVHRALEIWKFPSQSEADFLNWSAAEFGKGGLFREKDIRYGIRRAIRILERFQQTELYDRMSRSDLLRHEISFSLEDKEGAFKTGVIDALFLENGKWILVEFKTDEIHSDYQRGWLEKKAAYQDQVADYLEAAEQVLGQRPDPILCFLDFDDQVRLFDNLWQD